MWPRLSVACYFCCFYRGDDHEEEEEEDDESTEPIALLINHEYRTDDDTECVKHRGLDLRRIKSMLRNIATCRHHNLDAIEQYHWREIDVIVDATYELHREIKETMKALYRINDRVERSHCIARIEFLLARYEQGVVYTTDSEPGDTFHSIIVGVRDVDTQ